MNGECNNLKFKLGYFPGGPEAKTLRSQCRGPGFKPWLGSPHAATKFALLQLKTMHAATMKTQHRD